MVAGTIMAGLTETDIITIGATDIAADTTTMVDIVTTMDDGTGLPMDDMDTTAAEVPTKDPMPIEIPTDISKQEIITDQATTTGQEIIIGQTVTTDQEVTIGREVTTDPEVTVGRPQEDIDNISAGQA
jgi:hypothetical protein